MISKGENRLIGIVQIFLLTTTLLLAILWIRNPQGSYEPWTFLGGTLLAILELVRQNQTAKAPYGIQPAKTANEIREDEDHLLPTKRMYVTTPGTFRYILDQCFPKAHTWLTTRIGLFKQPPEWHALHDYLTSLRSTIANDIHEKTYVEPHAKDLPEETKLFKAPRAGFLTPIQQVIKEIVGISEGGDAQNAQIAAVSRKSRFVRNIVKRLLRTDEPLVLLGDPGTGKSLTLQNAAMLIAEKESKRIFPKVCLFIRLGEFQIPGEVNDRTVWEYVKKSTPQEVRPYLDSLHDCNRLVIFFDGMDEMSRIRYNEHTTALSVFAGSRKGNTKTLFSCRITDFTPKFQHNRLVLLPFSRKHVYRYLKRQIPSSRFPIKIGDKYWTPRELAKRLTQGDLPMQADNPFVLWLLCDYLQVEQDWPKSRVHLLDYYNRSNYARKIPEALQTDGSRGKMNMAFLTWGRIAYEITCRNEGVAIPLGDVIKFLAPEELPAVRTGIQCGVLQESLDLETILIRFEHHRFQEYFTALYLSGNSEVKSAVRWLDKLDAPRWQDTLFNLVLMGSGHEALVALDVAITQDLLRLDTPDSDGRSWETTQVETLLADRVELASRILQQTQQQHDDALTGLFGTFRSAAYWLSDHGNPITKVKMLWTSKIVPGIDIFRVARESLLSDVSWVRQQALIITSVASGAVAADALQEDVLHSFASGRFFNRFGGFVRIAAALKQKRLWYVLIIGVVLYLLQLLAGYGLVTAARTIVIPASSTVERVVTRTSQMILDLREHYAVEDKDEAEIAELQSSRERNNQWHAHSGTIADAVQNSFDSLWFLIALPITMLLILLYAMRYAPGHQFLAFQGAGYVFLLLPMILWPLWSGYWNNLLIQLIFFLPLFVPILIATSWVLTLLIHVFTLGVFIAGVSYWSGPVRKKRTLVEAVWENCGFGAWGKKIYTYGKYAFYVFCYYLAMIGFGYLLAERSIWKYAAAHYAFLPFLPFIVNLILSVFVYIEIIACAVILMPGRRRRHTNRGQSLEVFLGFTAVCLFSSFGVLLIWSLTLVNWRAVWTFIAMIFGLLPFFPPIINVVLSIVIWIEIVGCVAVILVGLKIGWGRSLEILIGWTAVCLGIAAITCIAWGAYVFSDLIARILAVILFFSLIAFFVFVFRRTTIDLVFLLSPWRRPMGYVRYSSEAWKNELQKLGPGLQARLLRRATPSTLELPIGDFMALLQEVEHFIEKEPALSAYWAKRYEIEQIMRQERSG